MPSNKKYTNTNFTKRVDHLTGYADKKRISEPAICTECEAVYTKGRWTFDKDFLTADPFNKIEPQDAICPACLKIRDRIPAGFVYIGGGFFNEHKEEIENLLRNEEEKIGFTNPLARIMDFNKSENGLTVTTTTENFAKHLGRALKKAYGGDVRYDSSHKNKLARVYWERDQ